MKKAMLLLLLLSSCTIEKRADSFMKYVNKHKISATIIYQKDGFIIKKTNIQNKVDSTGNAILKDTPSKIGILEMQ